MRSDSLSIAALKYAAGELAPLEASAFELRLADDGDAREALAEAVRLSSAAIGQSEPMPDPLFRQSVVEQLRPERSWVAKLFARRPYRGHPLTWTTAGAGTTAVAIFGLWIAATTFGPNDDSISNPDDSHPAGSPREPIPRTLPAREVVDPLAARSNPKATGSTPVVVGVESDVKTGRPFTFMLTFPMGGTKLGPFGDG